MHVIDLLKKIGISSTFNIEDLIEYKSRDFNRNNHLLDESFDRSRPLPLLAKYFTQFTEQT